MESIPLIGFLAVLFKFISCLQNPGDQYMKYSEIVDQLKSEVTNHVDTAHLFQIGHSVEGRPILGVKIGKPSNASKPALVIDAGLHAREWSPIYLALHTIHQLLSNESVSGLIDGLDWYIIPVLNPDGFVYSSESPKGRFWRKNRAQTPLSHVDPRCSGVDLNRNFDFAWGGPGSSENPCEEDYKGPAPFSEPESAAFANFMMSKAESIKVYLAIHSAGQGLLYPYGFTKTPPWDWMNLKTLAEKARTAIQTVRGTPFNIGTTTEYLSYGSGGSDDWAKGVLGIKYVYTIEMPGKIKPKYPLDGHHPPESELPIINREMFEGLKVFAEQAKAAN